MYPPFENSTTRTAILQKNNHYRISATPTFVWYVIDNYYKVMKYNGSYVSAEIRIADPIMADGIAHALRTGLIENVYFFPYMHCS